jgi:hypothetical protein
VPHIANFILSTQDDYLLNNNGAVIITRNYYLLGVNISSVIGIIHPIIMKFEEPRVSNNKRSIILMEVNKKRQVLKEKINYNI